MNEGFIRLRRNLFWKVVLLVLLVLVGAGVYFGAGSVPTQEKTWDKQQKSEAGILDHLVFITTSQGCQCTLRRNKEAKEMMGGIQKDFPELKVKNLDYILDNLEVNPLMQNNQISLLPALVFIASDGGVLYKIDGFLDNQTVREKIRFYQKVKGQNNGERP